MKTPTLFTLTLALCCASSPAKADIIPFVPINFDFGVTAATTPFTAEFGHYNNVTSYSVGIPVASAVDFHNNSTGISLAITTAFRNRVDNGNVSSDAGFHPNAQRDSFYLGSTDTYAELRLGNLDGDLLYDFVLFGSRSGTSTPRIVTFTIDGVNQDLDVVDNTSNVATFSNIAPIFDSISSQYVIDIGVTLTSGDTVMLSAMRVTPIPEPGMPVLLVTFLVVFGSVRRRRGCSR